MFRRYNIHFGVGIIVFIFVLSFFILNYGITSLNGSVLALANITEIRSVAKEIQVQDTTLANSVRGLLLDPNSSSDLEAYNLNSDKIALSIDKISKLDPANAFLFQNVNQMNRELTNLEAMMMQATPPQAMEIYNGEYTNIREKLQCAIAEYAETQRISVEKQITEAIERGQNTRNTALFVSFIGVFACLAVGFSLIRGVVKPVHTLSAEAIKVAEGNLSSDIPEIKVTNEISTLAKAFNKMLQSIKERELQLQEQHWLKSGISEVAGLFQGIEDIDLLADTVINKITPLVGAVYGLFYFLEQQGENQYLILKAAYAFESTVEGKAEILLGEGLVGQCALENRIIDLDNIPDGYIHITSGLGAAPAKSVTVVPVDFEGQVLAVIELASFDSLSRMQKSLLQEVRYDIGVAMNRVMGHQETKQLLNESQALTEELQSQSEELQLQSEELKTFNEKLEEHYKKSEMKNRELEQIKSVLEEKTHQLVLSSKYKSEFLSNMSHELRTPLNSLLILAQMLADNKKGNLLPFQVEYAQTIMSSGRDLLNIINDILDLAKVESGKMSINVEKVSLSEVIKSVKEQFMPVALFKDIKFEVSMEDGLTDDFCTDRNRLVQILGNLLSNAFKFTDEGKVKLVIKRAEENKVPEELRHQFNMPLLAFMVIDSGIGINKEDQDVIFEAFQQGDGTSSRKYGGTGLGLSISKELANLLGGFIHLKSKNGQGSIFTLYLPAIAIDRLAESSTAKAEVESNLEPKSGENITYDNNSPQIQPLFDSDELGMEYSLEGNKILVVDDDMRNVFAVTSALESQGIEVLFAENGKQALEVLQTDLDINLVLMDIMMPEMDGYEAMEQIRKMDRYRDLPIIALTAKAMKGDREKCLDAGASDYISKPLDVNQLLSLIRVWLYK